MSIAAVLEVEHETPPQLASVGDPEPTDRAHPEDIGAAPRRAILIVEDEPGLRE